MDVFAEQLTTDTIVDHQHDLPPIVVPPVMALCPIAASPLRIRNRSQRGKSPSSSTTLGTGDIRLGLGLQRIVDGCALVKIMRPVPTEF